MRIFQNVHQEHSMNTWTTFVQVTSNTCISCKSNVLVISTLKVMALIQRGTLVTMTNPQNKLSETLV